MDYYSSRVYRKIKGKAIGIAGCGGLGSNAAVCLARLGIEKFILSDFDIVRRKNLSRQMFFVNQVGKRKVIALKNTLRKINPFIRVKLNIAKLNKNNIAQVFEEADILIEALDKPEEKSKLITEFRRYFPNKPVICASGLAGCDSANTIKTRRIGKRIWVVGDVENEAGRDDVLLCSRVAIAAFHQANQAIRVILFGG